MSLNILFVVPYTPNLIRVRSYNLIRHLSERGNQVTVLTIWTNAQEREDVERLRQECYQVEAVYLPQWRSFWNCLKALSGVKPLQAVYSWHLKVNEKLSSLIDANRENGKRNFDVFHLEHLRGVQYGLNLLSKSNGSFSSGIKGAPVIWDSVDSIAHLFQQASLNSRKNLSRWIVKLELARTRNYEGWLSTQFDRVLVTSKHDKQAMESLHPSGKPNHHILVVPNGVDLSYFKPVDPATKESDTIVVSGKMSYHANVSMVLHLVQDIMPRVWATKPEVKLWIVGKEPPREVQALAKHPQIVVTGYVEDIRPYLQYATASIAPLTYGAGIQNKVLEAMACGTPVVCTPRAISALDVKANRDLLVAEDPLKIADYVLNLLMNHHKQVQMGQAGRNYVETFHQWSNIAGQVEEIYREAIADQDGE